MNFTGEGGAEGVGSVRVMLVDDHPIVRSSVRSFMDTTPDLVVVGEASDGQEAVTFTTRLLPDVVLMDLVMPGMDGAEATRRITSFCRGAQVLALTSSSEGTRVRDALGAGAVGYLLKESDPADILDGVRRVFRGESPLHPRAVRAMLTESRAGSGRHLTRRQVEVLQCLEAGLSNNQIAVALGISHRTVKVHVGDILKCLGVQDRETAATWARDLREGDVA